MGERWLVYSALNVGQKLEERSKPFRRSTRYKQLSRKCPRRSQRVCPWPWGVGISVTNWILSRSERSPRETIFLGRNARKLDSLRTPHHHMRTRASQIESIAELLTSKAACEYRQNWYQKESFTERPSFPRIQAAEQHRRKSGIPWNGRGRKITDLEMWLLWQWHALQK